DFNKSGKYSVLLKAEDGQQLTVILTIKNIRDDTLPETGVSNIFFDVIFVLVLLLSVRWYLKNRFKID
ncbi:MAG: hypothetical protein ACK5G7_01780, partial [Erysipelotrichaceae bacterium]